MKAGPGNQRQFRSSFCTSTSSRRPSSLLRTSACDGTLRHQPRQRAAHPRAHVQSIITLDFSTSGRSLTPVGGGGPQDAGSMYARHRRRREQQGFKGQGFVEEALRAGPSAAVARARLTPRISVCTAFH